MNHIDITNLQRRRLDITKAPRLVSFLCSFFTCSLPVTIDPHRLVMYCRTQLSDVLVVHRLVVYCGTQATDLLWYTVSDRPS